MSYIKEMAIARQAVMLASKLCQTVRSKTVTPQAMAKLDKSPVTIADYGSQAIICKFLREAFPGDPVVAEEDARDLKLPKMKDQLEQISSYVGQALGSSVKRNDILNWIDHGNCDPCSEGRFWTLDPIDGTKGFVRGDQYAICLALIEDGHVKLGLLGCPALELDGSIGHLFTAQQGQGTYRESLSHASPEDNLQRRRVHVSQNAQTWVQSVEASHGNHTEQMAVAKAVGIESVISMDSQAKYAMVACGEAALYLRLSSYKENIWDHAAGAIVVQEAGGKISDRNGKSLDFTSAKMAANSGVVVTNKTIHEKVLLTLKDC